MSSSSSLTSAARRVVRVPTPFGDAYQVTADFFLEKVLPPLRSHLDLDALIDKGTFRYAVTSQGKLWGYTKKSPSGIHSKEEAEAYAYLQRGARSIAKAIKKSKPGLVFYNNRFGTSKYAERTDETLPDAYLMSLSTPPHAVRWMDIAVSGEYKRENNADNVEENINKILASMLDCMRRDPSRRFTFGFTVEDASMKLWYCDRSQIVVSEPFDFIEQYRTLIHFLLSVTFAERHELGWDPTISPVQGDGEAPQYDITVQCADGGTAVYRTIGILSDSGPENLVGRGTRVWKAVKLVDGKKCGEPVALKDACVDNDREREGIIHEEVRSSLSSKDQNLEEYLLSVECHGDVHVAGSQDGTRILGPHFARRLRQSANQTRSPVHTSATSDLCHLVHYRIVFKEVGIPLYDINSLHVVFNALADAIYGIAAIHKSQYVHRDVSPGNILVVNGRGKITDMEYAVSEGQEICDIKIGTVYFVAVEAASQKYLFMQKKTTTALSAKDTSLVDRFIASGGILTKADLGAIPALKALETVHEHKFRYNPLHDIESLWWIAVFFVFNRRVETEDESAENTRLASQRRYANDLFYKRGYDRFIALSVVSDFAQQRKVLHPSLAETASLLEAARRVLVETYRQAEKDIGGIDIDVAHELYGQMHHFFRAAADRLRKSDVKVCRFGDL